MEPPPVTWLSQSCVYPLLISKLGVLTFGYFSFAVVLCTPRYSTAFGEEEILGKNLTTLTITL